MKYVYLSLLFAFHCVSRSEAFFSQKSSCAKQFYSPTAAAGRSPSCYMPPINTNKNSIRNNVFQKKITISPLLELFCVPPSLAAIAWVSTSVAGGISGAPIVMKSTKTWYTTIPLPSFTPPKQIFAPTWSTLYTLMGIASWRIRNISMSIIPNANPAGVLPFLQNNIVLLSLIHYAMNLSWAPLFFGLKRLRAGHVLNVMLVATLLPVIWVYFSLDVKSGILLLPYLVWLLLATRLSSAVCKLNPTEVTKHGEWYNNAKLQDQIWKLRKQAAKNIGL